ncbi:MAG TPA: hypothetical protein VFD58_19830 [Blastocatellia bacterium]|nr:hypothetical protein [Blastocatellia bacterium]
MLRIDIHQGKKVTNLILAGKLMGPWVTELERCWNAMLCAETCRPILPILVDLSKVTFIDERGKHLVAQMCQSGARLVGTGLIAGFFCREIEEEVRKCGGDCKDG